MGFSGELAWRFFRGNREHGLVSLISAISITGMTLAIALLVVVLSVMNGFEEEFRERILGVVPHARLQFEMPREDWRELQGRFLGEAGITRVVPFIEFEALAIYRGAVTPVGVQGIDSAVGVTALEPFVEWGQSRKSLVDYRQSPGSGEILVGAALAKRIGLETGDKLRLLRVEAMTGETTQSANKRTRIYSATVAGILNTGTQLDNQVGLVDLAFAQEIKGLGDRVEGLQFQVNDVFQARKIVYESAKNSGIHGYFSDWKSTYGNLHAAIQLSRQLVVMLVATIVAVAVFNIFVTLGMVVRYKRKEIAILKTLGLTRSRVLKLFFWQGVIIALPGCVIGAAIGVALSAVLPELVIYLQDFMDRELLSTEIYPISYLPTAVRTLDIVVIVAVALVMSFIATLLPAFQAARLAPAVVLNQRS